jgi:hypothetical protein
MCLYGNKNVTIKNLVCKASLGTIWNIDLTYTLLKRLSAFNVCISALTLKTLLLVK